MSTNGTTRRRGKVAAVTATLLVGAGLGTGATVAAVRVADDSASEADSSATPVAASSTLTVGQIYEKVSEGVVE